MDALHEGKGLMAFRVVDGQVVLGQVEQSTLAVDTLAGVIVLQNPVVFAFVQKPALLAGEPPKPVPAMQKYRTLPLFGAVVEKLALTTEQFIGEPELVSEESLIDLYFRTFSGKSEK